MANEKQYINIIANEKRDKDFALYSSISQWKDIYYFVNKTNLKNPLLWQNKITIA